MFFSLIYIFAPAFVEKLNLCFPVVIEKLITQTCIQTFLGSVHPQLTWCSNGDVGEIDVIVVVDERLSAGLQAQGLVPTNRHPLRTDQCANAGIWDAGVALDALHKRRLGVDGHKEGRKGQQPANKELKHWASRFFSYFIAVKKGETYLIMVRCHGPSLQSCND